MPQSPLNIDKLYEACMSGNTVERITARTVYDYCISPFIVYCNIFAPEKKKDPLPEYERLLFEQGKLHEEQVIATNYPGVQKVSFKTPQQGFKLLLEEMRRGVSVICGAPVFYLPEGLTGTFDVLERRGGQKSVFGNYHYIVKEIKLAKNIQRHHIYQAAFYNYVIGKIQGFTPSSFKLINRDLEETEQDYDEVKLLEILTDIREIQNGKKVCPTYGACGWPWETYNDDEAIRMRDISLVGGVGPSFKQKLAERNVFTFDELAKTSLKDLTSIRGIKEKTATKFLNNSKALVSGKHIRLNSCQFPKKKTEIFLDLEGTGEQVQEDELVAIDYMIGLLVRSNGQETYIPFIAYQLNQEKTMFYKFVNWILGQQDFIIYHWHHYESTHIKRLVERYGLSKEAEPILANMIDLHKIATSNFAFPTYGNGLKEIAPYVGYKWKHADVNAMESIALYFQYVQDPVANKEKLEKVIDYNRDDCMATLRIKDWLERESSV
jgi:uncharacterized protein